MVEQPYHLSSGCKVITFIDYRRVVVDKYTKHAVSNNINVSTVVNLWKPQISVSDNATELVAKILHPRETVGI